MGVTCWREEGAETNNGDGRKFVPMSFIIIFTIFYFYEQKMRAWILNTRTNSSVQTRLWWGKVCLTLRPWAQSITVHVRCSSNIPGPPPCDITAMTTSGPCSFTDSDRQQLHNFWFSSLDRKFQQHLLSAAYSQVNNSNMPQCCILCEMPLHFNK